MAYVGDVILVGADRASAHHLGFKCASTLGDALEMAEQTVGRYPSVSHLRMPPLLLANVT
jgi:hypothetical protein